jgi:tetratricopeptide (TPR) repeat protein
MECRDGMKETALDKGYCMYHSGQIREAVRQFETVLATEPENLSALKGLALASVDAHDLESAKNALSTYVQLKPDDQRYLRIYADVLTESNSPAEAAQYYYRCLHIEYSHRMLEKMMHCVSALTPQMQVQLLTPVVERYPQAETAQMQLAEAYIKGDDTEAATSVLERACSYETCGRGKVQVALSRIYFDNKRYEDAYPLVAYAVECSPRNPIYRYYLYRLAYELGHFYEALQAIDLLCQASPNDPRYLFAKGLCLAALDKPKEALTAMEAAQQLLRSDSWRFHYHMGLVAVDAGDIPRAELEFERAIELAPSEVPPRRELAKLRERA